MGRKSRVLPREICSSAHGLARLRGVAMGEQKSAEAVLAAAHER
jgi:hypothetical protein